MATSEHWDGVYLAKRDEEVSWFRPHLDLSLDLIGRLGQGPSAEILDVGGGRSTLVDDLLKLGAERITVLDLASAAIAQAQARLGDDSARVRWMAGDIMHLDLPAHAFDIWHDRACFHFLTEPKQRSAYRAQLCRALRPGGVAILAAFAPDGPRTCSGLPVARYDAAALRAELGETFTPIESGREAAFQYMAARQAG